MALITASHRTGAAYDRIAPFYDRFTDGYDYETWIEAILEQARLLGLSGSNALDIACGTGNSSLPLMARGYAVTGCDISEEMIREAQRKLPEEADAFFVADMRDLPPIGEFDLVLCLDDAINYLLSDSELERTFAGVAELLSPGGVFAFDVNTVRSYRTSFAETFVSEVGGAFFAWRGEAGPNFMAGERASAAVEIFAVRDDGLWERHLMRHVQRHHPRDAILAALERSGLRCCATLGQHSGAILEHRVDEHDHIKLVYLAKRGNRY